MTFRGKSSRLVTPQRTSGLRCNAVAHPVQISLATVDNRNDDELGFIVGMLLGQELLYFTDRGVSRFERQQKLRVLVYLALPAVITLHLRDLYTCRELVFYGSSRELLNFVSRIGGCLVDNEFLWVHAASLPEFGDTGKCTAWSGLRRGWLQFALACVK